MDKELLNQMLDVLDVRKSVEHIEWLTNNTPNRLSGAGQDLKAAEYICKIMESYGFLISKHTTVTQEDRK